MGFPIPELNTKNREIGKIPIGKSGNDGLFVLFLALHLTISTSRAKGLKIIKLNITLTLMILRIYSQVDLSCEDQ